MSSTGEGDTGTAMPAGNGGMVGRSVYTRDGEYLGTIAELDPGTATMKINAPQALDYWLPRDTVRGVVEGQVLLLVDHTDVLRLRRASSPADEPRAY